MKRSEQVCHSANGQVKWKVNWKLSGFACLMEQLTSSAGVSLDGWKPSAPGSAGTAAAAAATMPIRRPSDSRLGSTRANDEPGF